MALWHDPLDELIADLEREIPPVAPCNPIANWDRILMGTQTEIVALVWGTEEQRRRLEDDPCVKIARAYWASTRRVSDARPGDAPAGQPGRGLGRRPRT
jgi:hypothetical protein